MEESSKCKEYFRMSGTDDESVFVGESPNDEEKRSECLAHNIDVPALHNGLGSYILGEDESLNVKLLSLISLNDLDGLSSLIKASRLDVVGPARAFGSPLHLITAVGTEELVNQIIQMFPECIVRWANEKDCPEQQTVLHIAAANGKLNLIRRFLMIDGVDDTIIDSAGRAPCDVAANKAVFFEFISHRKMNVKKILEFIGKNIGAPGGTKAIIEWFDNSKARAYLERGWLDIDTPMDKSTDQGILHLAARYNDMELANWALNFGADRTVRDNRGKRPYELVPKKSQALRQRLSTETSMGQKFISANIAMSTMINQFENGLDDELPYLKDTMFKWTNYASGFKPRYFVLDKGVLSYYKSIYDYPSACRGFIYVSTCVVEMSNRDPTKLELCVHGHPYFTIQARSQIYAKKWFWALAKSKKLINDRIRKKNALTKSTKNGVSHFSIDKGRSLSLGTSDQLKNTTSTIDKQSQSDMDNRLSNLSLDVQRMCDSADSSIGNLRNALISQVNALNGTIQVPLNELKRIYDSDICRECLDKIKTLNSDKSGDREKVVEESAKVIRELIAGVISTANRLVSLQVEREEKLAEVCKHKAEIIKSWQDKLNEMLEQRANRSLNLEIKQSGSQNDVPGSTDIFYDAEEIDMTSINKSSLKSLSIQSRSDELNSTVYPVVPIKHPFIPITTEEAENSIIGYPATDDQRRTKLPLDPTKPKPTVQVWSFIKSAIGKDLSRITLPVLFNEPLSTLQRLCEDVAYIDLLSLVSRIGCGKTEVGRKTDSLVKKKAEKLGFNYYELVNLDEKIGVTLRCLLIAVFAISTYSSTRRIAKPFNPLLGETFELSSAEKYYRYVSEQVCHHPPISASHCESPDYCITTEVNMKSKFWGKSFEILPAGYTHLVLAIPTDAWEESSGQENGINMGDIEDAMKTNLPPYKREIYTWTKVSTYITNLVFGKMKLENRGSIIVKNENNKVYCNIGFVRPKQSGMSNWISDWASGSKMSEKGDDITIKGQVFDDNGVVVWEIFGNHFSSICAKPAPTIIDKIPEFLRSPFVVWTADPYPNDSAKYYEFTYTALALNECSDKLASILPPSDSRLRPDQRFMENEMWDDASAYKEFLEDLQRRRRAEYIKAYTESNTINKRDDYENLISMIPSSFRAPHPGEQWWKPRWFINTYNKTTNSTYWRFTGDYWNWRVRSTQPYCSDEGPAWPDWVSYLYDKKTLENGPSNSPEVKKVLPCVEQSEPSPTQ